MEPDHYRRRLIDFARVARNDGDNLYAVLPEMIMEESDLMELARLVPVAQPTANIVMGAIHYLLLKGVDSPVQEYYGTLTDTPRPPDDELRSHLLEFCRENREDLEDLCKTKRVQTNEVRRSIFLLPSLTYLHERIGPFQLIELGTSAGLLLNFDQYSYDYSHRDTILGSGPLVLQSEVRGTPPPLPGSWPQVIRRVGVDINPLYCHSDDDKLWLLALVWPGNLPRFNRLREALEICTSSQLELVKDDGFTNITGLLEQYSYDVPTVLYHSFAINQIHREARDKFYNDLRTYATTSGKTIYEIRNGWHPDDSIDIELRVHSPQSSETTKLADVHHHGEWISWVAP
ncbi:MAG: DUF2332 domain-containing protein [Candidatus Kariarchaeaceae archaeon]|jgi:hypothetical protein